MDDILVDGQHYDQVVIDWISEMEQEEVDSAVQDFFSSQSSLTRRMIGLQRVGESSLTLEPMSRTDVLL